MVYQPYSTHLVFVTSNSSRSSVVFPSKSVRRVTGCHHPPMVLAYFYATALHEAIEDTQMK